MSRFKIFLLGAFLLVFCGSSRAQNVDWSQIRQAPSLSTNGILTNTGGILSWQASAAGIPCTTTALSFQFNNGGVFGCVADWTFTSPHTVTIGPLGVLNLSFGTTVTGITPAMIPILNQNTTGNAATSTAFATTPSLCSTGFAPTGILANGNSTGCAAIGGGTTVSIQTNGTPNTLQTILNHITSTVNISGLIVTPSNPGGGGNEKFEVSGTLAHSALPALVSADIPNNAANTTGNAATSSAFATVPALCSVGNAPIGILANGNATGCAAIGGGTTVALQTNSVANSSQTTLNLINSTTNASGLTLTETNTTGGTVKGEIAGTLAHSALPALVSADIPNNAANTTGTSQNVTGTVAPLNGGTGVSSPVAHSDPQAEGAAPYNYVPAGSALTGQLKTANNGADPSYKSPGFPGRTVVAASDSILCDSGTALRDRFNSVVYTNATSTAVTIPDAGTTGCGANFATKVLMGPGAGAGTFTRATASTFTVLNGATALSAQTSFGLTVGQSASIWTPDNSNWIVVIATGGSGGGGGTPCTATALSFQYNNAGAFGCVPDLTFVGPHTTTLGAAGLVDLSAATSASAFKIPVQAGCTAASNGVLCYDTTAGNTHQRSNGADSLSVAEFSALAAGFFPKQTDATHGLLAQSLCDEGITTINVMTCTDSAGMTITGTTFKSPNIVTTSSGTGYIYFVNGTDNCVANQPANSVCWEAPASIGTSYHALFAATPSTGIPHYAYSAPTITETISLIGIADLSATGTPSSTTFLRGDNTWAVASGGGGTPCTTTALSFQYNNAGAFGCVPDITFSTPHTMLLGASGLVDFSAMSGANAFKIPVQAGCTAGADGDLCYDSTNKNVHQRANGADSLSVSEATAVASGFIPKSSNASTALLTASLCDEAITTANAFTCTDTAGIRSPAFTATGTTAGFADYPQGTTSASTAPCNTATSICEQAPTSVTSYVLTKPGAAPTNNFSTKTTTTAGVESYNKMQQMAIITSDYTNATTTLSNVTGLSFALDASTNYSYTCQLIYQGSAATASLVLGFTGPASPTQVTGSVSEVTTSGAGAALYETSTNGTVFTFAIGSTAIVSTATDLRATLTGGIINGTNAGTLQLQAKSNGTGTVTIKAGSSCVMQ